MSNKNYRTLEIGERVHKDDQYLHDFAWHTVTRSHIGRLTDEEFEVNLRDRKTGEVTVVKKWLPFRRLRWRDDSLIMNVLLCAAGGVTARQIAKEKGMATKTVRRTLETLRKSGRVRKQTEGRKVTWFYVW